MNKLLDEYLDIRYKVGQEFQGRYAGQQQKLAVHLLDHAYDFVAKYRRLGEPVPKKLLADYLYEHNRITASELGFSSLFFWFILRMLIKWIVRNIL